MATLLHFSWSSRYQLYSTLAMVLTVNSIYREKVVFGSISTEDGVIFFGYYLLYLPSSLFTRA